MLVYNAQGAETGRYWYHFDALGSVIALSQYDDTDTYASIVERYEYSAFGETTVCDGSGTPRTPNQSAYGNSYMFTGRRYDPETATATQHGLYYYRARIYSPDLGRFLQPDPIGYSDGMNMYAYVGNNPLNFIDPSGLLTFKEADMSIVQIGYERSMQAFILADMASDWAKEEAARLVPISDDKCGEERKSLMNSRNLTRNALQHAYGSALAYSLMPSRDAMLVLFIHEEYGNGSATDTNVDYWNNEIGRQIANQNRQGVRNPNNPLLPIQEAVLEAYNNGRLTSTDPQIDQRNLRVSEFYLDREQNRRSEISQPKTWVSP